MADLSGVPRPTWANLESGEANPTILVLTKVANALGVGVEQLLSGRNALQHLPVSSLPERNHGGVSVRKLGPDTHLGLEFERLEFEPGALLMAKASDLGTRKYVSCERGELELVAAGQRIKLRAGDVATFKSDQSHSFNNPGRSRAIGFSVVTFAAVSG